MKIYLFIYVALIMFFAGCTISSDSSNAATSWDDRATANRELKQEELILKQDQVLKRQQKEFEDLHRQENIQDEYRRRNLRQNIDDGEDSYN